MNTAIAPLVRLSHVVREFRDAPGTPRILSDICLEVNAGETVAIVGPSGSGKSTLLNLIGALDSPTSGQIEFEGRELSDLNEDELARVRNQSIGFVFQLHHLLPQCTALENVLIPTLVNPAEGVQERAKSLLKRVGLGERMSYRPGVLSGGERQRIAFVRALINRPKLLLADEPTGSLNADAAEDLTRLMLEINREEGTALVVVTHSNVIAQMMSRTLHLERGEIHPLDASHAQ